MHLANVAQNFIDYYNEKENTDFNAAAFFEKVFFPTVLDYEQSLNFVTNSNFNSPSSVKGRNKTKEGRAELLQQFKEKLSEGHRDGCMVISYPAAETKSYGTLSSLFPDTPLDYSEDVVYLSWIGHSLSFCVAGGWLFSFDIPELNYQVFKSWTIYRELVEAGKVASKSICAWNTRFYCQNNISSKDDVVAKNLVKKKGAKLITASWVDLYFCLCQRIQKDEIVANVFSLGQENQTIGFLPIDLSFGRKFVENYGQSFDTDKPTLVNLIGKSFGFLSSHGRIDKEALAPKFKARAKDKPIEAKVTNKLIEMTGTTNLSDLAKQFSSALFYYTVTKRKSPRNNLQKLLLQKSKVNFMLYLDDVMDTLPKKYNDLIFELIGFLESCNQSEFRKFSYSLNLYYKLNLK